MKGESPQARHMEVLSRLAIRGLDENHELAEYDQLEKLRRESRYVARLSDEEFADFAALADEILVVAAPGANVADLRQLRYEKLRPGVKLL